MTRISRSLGYVLWNLGIIAAQAIFILMGIVGLATLALAPFWFIGRLFM